MLDNLTVLAIVIIVFWIGALGYYYFTAKQQKAIREELEQLRSKLDELEEQGR